MLGQNDADNHSSNKSRSSDGCDSSTVGSTRNTRGPDGVDRQAIRVATKEQRRVTISKFVLVIVLAAVAATLSVLTYVFVRNGEEADFDQTVRLWLEPVNYARVWRHVLTSSTV